MPENLNGDPFDYSCNSRLSQENEARSTETMVHEKDKLLLCTSRIAQILLSGDDDFDKPVNMALDLLGETTGADRVYVWHLHKGKIPGDETLYTTQLYEWSPLAEPQQGKENTVNSPLECIAPSWLEAFKHDRCVNMLVRDMSES